MNLQELRSTYRDQIVSIAGKHKASNVRVFGSVASDTQTAVSDIDLLVHFAPDASLLDEAGLAIELHTLLGRNVDVIGDDVVREEFKPFIFAQAVPL